MRILNVKIRQLLPSEEAAASAHRNLVFVLAMAREGMVNNLWAVVSVRRGSSAGYIAVGENQIRLPGVAARNARDRPGATGRSTSPTSQAKRCSGCPRRSCRIDD